MLSAVRRHIKKNWTEKVAGNTNACIGFVLDRATQEYVPNTVVREDIRDLTRCALRVIAVYRKEASALRYEELTYAAKNLDLLELEYPEALAYLKWIVT